MPKDDLNVHVFQNWNWSSPKSDRWFFSLTLTVRRPFHRKDFKWKKYEGKGLFSEKTKALHAELNKRAEAATSHQDLFCSSRFFRICLFGACDRESFEEPLEVFSSWIFLYRIFLMTLIMVTEHLFWRKVLCGCFCLIWLLLLSDIIKSCTEWCALELHCTSLIW